MKMAYVKWVDCRLDTAGVAINKAVKSDGMIMHTSGMLLEGGSDDFIRLAKDIYVWDDEGELACRNRMAIPKVNVLEMRVFEVEAVKPSENDSTFESRNPLVGESAL